MHHADEGAVAADVKRGYPLDGKADWASTWEDTLFQLLASIPAEMLKQVAGLQVQIVVFTALLHSYCGGTAPEQQVHLAVVVQDLHLMGPQPLHSWLTEQQDISWPHLNCTTRRRGQRW
jgi:hypothetical protein